MPLDLCLILESARKTRRVLITHAAGKFCGFGAEIACQITESLHAMLLHPVVRIGALNSPVPYSTHFEELHTPDADRIFDNIMNIFNVAGSDR